METLLKFLVKGGRIKIPKLQRPEEEDKTDGRKYCAYYRMIAHPTRSCYIVRDQIQILVDARVLKLHPVQETASVNMTTCLHTRQTAPIVTEVNHIPQFELELRIVNLHPANQKEKGHVSISTPDGARMLVHPHFLYANE